VPKYHTMKIYPVLN